MQKKVLIIGSYGSSNIGDEAILEVLLEKLSENNLSVLSGNKNDTKKRHNIKKIGMHFPFGLRSFMSFHWISSYKLLFQADYILLGGGGLFVDNYTIKAPLLWAWHVFWARVFQKPVYAFSQSIGPLNTSIGRIFTKMALSACKSITLRDAISVKNLQELLPHKNINKGTDIVFAYKEICKISYEGIKRKKSIALNFRDWNMNFDDIPLFIKNCIQKGYQILLIPMEQEDEKILNKIYQQLEDTSSVLLVVPSNYQELLQILHTCDKAIGMRLHFLIAAALAGCKVSGISYSSKVEGILQDIDIFFLAANKIQSDKDLFDLYKETRKAKNSDIQIKKVKRMFELLQEDTNKG
jgi:polysaccharide pyruvyl transferase CsaB